MEFANPQNMFFFCVGATLALVLLGLVCVYLLFVAKRKIDGIRNLPDIAELQEQIEYKKHLTDTIALLHVVNVCFTVFQLAFLIIFSVLLGWALMIHFSI